MINASQIVKAKQAVLDATEEQLDLLWDAGMTDAQRMEFYQDLVDHFAAEVDELENPSDDEEIEEDEGELDD